MVQIAGGLELMLALRSAHRCLQSVTYMKGHVQAPKNQCNSESDWRVAFKPGCYGWIVRQSEGPMTSPPHRNASLPIDYIRQSIFHDAQISIESLGVGCVGAQGPHLVQDRRNSRFLVGRYA